jgi:acetoin utilization protein AcuB
MLVRNIMTTPVVTVQPDMPVLEASKLMKEKKISRLPVEEKGKLLGIVTKDRLLRAAPSSATSLSLHEIHYLYAKLTVREIMQRHVVSVGPETTVEAAVRVAQESKVGCLPVVENGKVVGILTTNDFFYVILNPVLGIGEGGSRAIVRRCGSAKQVVTAIQCVDEMGYKLTNAAYLPSRRGEENDLMIHIGEADPTALVECMKKKGLDAEGRER